MHVRITRGRFDPARAADVERLTGEVADAVKGLPGFVSYQGGLDREAGTIVAISTWESESTANFPREMLGDVIPRVTELAQLEPPDIYEVVSTA
jgi:quinol monooxygenase YgiN